MPEKEMFQRKLTTTEIDAEIDKVRDFFAQISNELKAEAADRFICEIVNWAAQSHYEALGIFQEAMIRYRNRSIEAYEEVAEEDRIEKASENAIEYRCIKNLDLGSLTLYEGELYKIGFVEEREDYSDGKRYAVFYGEKYYDICGKILREHFVRVGE